MDALDHLARDDEPDARAAGLPAPERHEEVLLLRVCHADAEVAEGEHHLAPTAERSSAGFCSSERSRWIENFNGVTIFASSWWSFRAKYSRSRAIALSASRRDSFDLLPILSSSAATCRSVSSSISRDLRLFARR